MTVCLSVDRFAALLFSDSPLARRKMTKVETEVQLEVTYNVYKYKSGFAVVGMCVCVCVSKDTVVIRVSLNNHLVYLFLKCAYNFLVLTNFKSENSIVFRFS